jgi:hypothetical protein
MTSAGNREENMRPMNLDKAGPPIIFSANDVEFLSNFPNGRDKLWSATIHAHRHGLPSHRFENVLFVESPMEGRTLVYVYGIEHEDGYPQDLRGDLATEQQTFVKFLRDENTRDDEVLGWMTHVFSGSDYACVYKATAAFNVARGVEDVNIGVSYHDEHKVFQLIAVKPDPEGA